MTGRGLRGRRLARLMIATAVAVDAIVIMLSLTAPNGVGPMFVSSPGVAPSPVPLPVLAGVVAHVVGYLWMIRIYRADPEARPSAWRSHRS